MVVRLASLLLLLLISAAEAKPLLVDDAQLATLRLNAKATTSLLKKCQKELAEPTHALADFAPAPHYTSQGTMPDDDLAKGLIGDIRRAYRAALCYRLNGNTAYAAKTQAIADAWATTMKSASTPQGRGDINFNMAQLVVAASWVEGVNGWDAAPFKAWLSTTIAPLSLGAEANNRGNWGNLLGVSIAAFLQDAPGLQATAARWQSLLASQVGADGTLPLEICRSNTSNRCGGTDKGINGMAYTHYALQPATIAGVILKQGGLETSNADGTAAFNRAMESAATFTRTPTQFPFYASNSGRLNKLNACSYFAAAQLIAPNENARAALRAGKCKSDSWMLLELFGEAVR